MSSSNSVRDTVINGALKETPENMRAVIEWDAISAGPFSTSLTKKPIISRGCYAGNESPLYKHLNINEGSINIEGTLVDEVTYTPVLLEYYFRCWQKAPETNKIACFMMILDVCFGQYWNLDSAVVACKEDSKEIDLVDLTFELYSEMVEESTWIEEMPSHIIRIIPLPLLFCVSRRFTPENTKIYMENRIRSIKKMVSYEQTYFSVDLYDINALIQTSNNFQNAMSCRRLMYDFVREGKNIRMEGTGETANIFSMIHVLWDFSFMTHLKLILQEICRLRPWILGLHSVMEERRKLIIFYKAIENYKDSIGYARFFLRHNITDIVTAKQIPILSGVAFHLAARNALNSQSNLRTNDKAAHVRNQIEFILELVLECEKQLIKTEFGFSFVGSLSNGGKAIVLSTIKKLTDSNWLAPEATSSSQEVREQVALLSDMERAQDFVRGLPNPTNNEST